MAEELTAVPLNGKNMTIQTWLANNVSKLWLASAIALGVVTSFVGVIGLTDFWGDEEARQTPPGVNISELSVETIQGLPLVDGSRSIDYVPLSGLFLVPAIYAGAAVYGNKFKHHTKSMVFVDKSNISDFEKFQTTRDDYSALDPVWIGGVQVCAAVKEELATLLETMDGPFTSSMMSCHAIAARMEVHTGQTYQYLYPALRMKGSNTNQSLKLATEEMVHDVQLLRELLTVCSQLYVQSHFNSGHNTILANEIDRITTQIDSVREANDASALPAKASEGNLLKPSVAITDGSEKADLIRDFKAKKASKTGVVAE
jgi:hypothetical protein